MRLPRRNIILAAQSDGQSGADIGVQLDERDSSGWVLKALRITPTPSSRAIIHRRTDPLPRARRRLVPQEIAAHWDAELSLRQLTAIVEGAGGPLPVWDIDLLPAERDYRSEDLGELLSQMSCEGDDLSPLGNNRLRMAVQR
jgi:hypothetical protein